MLQQSVSLDNTSIFQAISESDGHHFMILFKDGLKFRGLYVHNLENEQVMTPRTSNFCFTEPYDGKLFLLSLDIDSNPHDKYQYQDVGK